MTRGRAGRRDLALGLVLAALGGLGLLWHVGQAPAEGRASDSGPVLVCPLGGGSF